MSGAEITTGKLAGVWVALLALTAIEVVLAFRLLSPVLFLVILLALSIGKAVMIAAWFMHLALAPRRLSLVLFPPLAVFIIALAAILTDAKP